MNIGIKILMGYILDLIFGDPMNVPHPVQLIGKLIAFLEKRLYNLKNKRFAGGVLCIVTLLVTFIVTGTLGRFFIIEIYLLYTILATKCLADEGKKVYRILLEDDIEKARRELSYLVSRDTKTMERRDIIRSTMETISENTVDGIVAPLFYMLLGGLLMPESSYGALAFGMTYKAVNTLDSMVGYKNDKYMDFGYVSAKVDDLFNLIPARITGMILYPLSALILGYDSRSALRIYFRDRLNHASPNSAHPEAAAAGALGIQFGGKTSYFGQVFDKPTIGDKVRGFEIDDILSNVKLMYVSSFLFILPVVVILNLI